MRAWQLQGAKARLSEVVTETNLHGPQEITLHGKSAVIVISKGQYNKLLNPKPGFIDFIKSSPLMGSGIKLQRDASLLVS